MYYDLPSDSAAGAARESFDIEAGEHTEQGGDGYTNWLALLYCVLIFPACMLAFVSVFAMDNPGNSEGACGFNCNVNREPVV